MKTMRCFGEFQNDRTCDLCGLHDPDLRCRCVAEADRRTEERDRLSGLRSGCPFLNREFPTAQGLWMCCKPGQVEVECVPVEGCMTK